MEHQLVQLHVLGHLISTHQSFVMIFSLDIIAKEKQQDRKRVKMQNSATSTTNKKEADRTAAPSADLWEDRDVRFDISLK